MGYVGNLLEYLVHRFRSNDVLWALHGGLAANAYRDEVRQTMDTDILVSAQHTTIRDLAHGLETDGWEVVTVVDDYLARLKHSRFGNLDVAYSLTDYEHGAVERAQQRLAHDGIPMLTVEDVVIHKLVASRWKDDMDVVSILSTSPELDLTYINRWLAVFEKSAHFDRLRAIARAEAGKRGQ